MRIYTERFYPTMEKIVRGLHRHCAGSFRRVATRCRLTAPVTSERILTRVMRWAGTLMLMCGARRRSTTRAGASTQADAVYQQREYRDR